MKTAIGELGDYVDNLGTTYLLILFLSGAIWAFIAVDNFENTDVFKLALIYSLLLIFGLLAVLYDRQKTDYGFDTQLWSQLNVKRQLAIGVGLFAVWYLVFMNSGFSIATAQSVTGVTFSVSPTLNYLLTSVLGPIAENIFFFGFLNITFIYLLRKLAKNRTSTLIFAGVLASTFPLFSNVPNSMIFVLASATIIAITGLTTNETVRNYGPVLASALFVGATIFPKFHGYAYRLNEANYIAASWFGLFMSIVAYYVGIMPVDIVHIGNNAIAAGG